MNPCCGPEARETLAPAAVLFHSLADPVRLAIVQRLSHGKARVVDLTRQLGLAQSTVSKHLACLRDCQLIDYRAEGRQSFYFVARPELLDLLRSAEGLLAATGEAVVLCPIYGTSAQADADVAVEAGAEDGLMAGQESMPTPMRAALRHEFQEAAADGLRDERSDIDGIAMAGMPTNAPGMGEPSGQPLEVVAAGADSAVEPFIAVESR